MHSIDAGGAIPTVFNFLRPLIAVCELEMQERAVGIAADRRSYKLAAAVTSRGFAEAAILQWLQQPGPS